jgi:FKBP-type peptidyl-prolyl cis-trans isomerase
MLHISSSIGSSSQLHSVNAAHKRDAHPKSSTAVSVPSGFAVMRPSVISSKKLLSSARSSIQMNFAAGDMDDSSPTEDERSAEVKSEASKMYSSKISLVAVAASVDPVESLSHGSDEYQVSVARKISVDIGGEHIDSTAATLCTAAAESNIQAFNRDIDESSFAPALMQRVAAADAAAKLSAVEIAKLTAQVEDLQAATQAHKAPQTKSNDALTSALQRASVAEANVQTLTSQVKDLQVASDAAAKLSAVENAKLTAQVEDLQAATQAHKAPQTKSNDALTSALQRASVAEANVQTLTSQVKDLQAASDAAAKLSAVENAKLTAQVEDLQAATQAHKAPQTKSNDALTSALQRASVAEANVQTLTSQVMYSLQGTGRLNPSRGGSDRRTVSFKKVRSVVFQNFVAPLCRCLRLQT